MERKYNLSDEIFQTRGHVLHRIVAVRDFADVKAGDKGGWIESEGNLSHDDDAWVYGDAWVDGEAKIYGEAKVSGNAVVSGDAEVGGHAKVCGHAKVYGDAWVDGEAKIYGEAKVSGNAVVSGDAEVGGHAKVCGHAKVYGEAVVGGDAEVGGEAKVRGNAEIYGNARVISQKDYIVFKNWWSSGRWFTWTRSNNRWKVGCFYCRGDELIEKAYADSAEKGREYGRVVRYVEAILADEAGECGTVTDQSNKG